MGQGVVISRWVICRLVVACSWSSGGQRHRKVFRCLRKECTCVSNWDAHKVNAPPVLLEFLYEGLVFLCFFLQLGFEVEVGAKSHFYEQEGA